MAWWEAALMGASSAGVSKLLQDDPKVDYTLAQKGIQWRVEDAKKAGLHPLAALGANISSAPVVSSGGDTGKAMAAGAIDAMMRDRLQKRDDMETRLGEAEITLKTKQSEYWDAQTQAINSETARAGQFQNSSQDYSLQDSVIDPRPRAVKTYTGKKVKAGEGSPAQRLEDEYGEIADIEGAMRYIRDVTLPDWKQVLKDWMPPIRVTEEPEKGYRVIRDRKGRKKYQYIKK